MLNRASYEKVSRQVPSYTKLESKRSTRTSTKLRSKTSTKAHIKFGSTAGTRLAIATGHKPESIFLAPQPIDTVYQRVEERLISSHNTYTCLFHDYFGIVVTFACTHAPCTLLSIVSDIVLSLLCLLTRRILVSSDITIFLTDSDSIFVRFQPLPFEMFPPAAFLPSSDSFLVDSSPLRYKSGGGIKEIEIKITFKSKIKCENKIKIEIKITFKIKVKIEIEVGTTKCFDYKDIAQ